MLRRLKVEQFEEIYDILKSSFPSAERRSKAGQKKIFDDERYSVFGWLENEKIVGFAAVWKFESFAFLEHFAVKETARNQGLGGLILNELKNALQTPVILEIEPPEDDLKRRRIAFYERHGFKLNDFDYTQPPMQNGQPEIKLFLMSSDRKISKDEFWNIKKVLYREIYAQE